MEKLKPSEQQISADYHKIKETVLDLQAQSMEANLIVSGLLEQVGEDSEKNRKTLIIEQLKSQKTVNKSPSLIWVEQSPTAKNPDRKWLHLNTTNRRSLSRAADVKGTELKGTSLTMNGHFPAEILHRWEILFPIWKKFIQAVISVDKPNVDGRLYKEEGVTTWLT